MNHWKLFRLFAIPIVLALLVSSLMYSPVLADDSNPPPPTEETTTTEPFTVDLQAPLAEPIVVNGDTASDVLALIPEGTEVVVLDENGERLPLASQKTADVIVAGDPIWCPAGVAVPVDGGNGCSPSTTSFQGLGGLLFWMFLNNPNKAGTIWIEGSYNSTVAGDTAVVIDGGTYTNMTNFALTIKGGWDGLGTGTVNSNNQSVFNTSLSVMNWKGDVTLSNILVNGSTNSGTTTYALDVETTKNIVLKNVKVQDSENTGAGSMYGAYINNYLLGLGSGTVTVTDSSFNNNELQGLYILSTKAITLKNIFANSNGDDGIRADNTYSTNAQAVTISNSSLNSNGGDGLTIRSNGAVTLTNINSTFNSGYGTRIDNDNLVPAVAAAVKITGANNFSDNGGYGLYVTSNGTISVNNTNANYNSGYGAYLINNNLPSPLAPQNVTITGFLTTIYNGSYGLSIASDGSVTTNNLTASFNGSDGVHIDNTAGALGGHKPVMLLGTNWFDSNTGEGLQISSNGAITLTNINAFYNYGVQGGVYIENDNDLTKPQNVTFKGPSVFQANQYYGLSVFTHGAVVMSNVSANNNGWAGGSLYDGVRIDNDGGSILKPVTISGYNNFNSNDGYGLQIDSLGIISLSNITANSNGREGANIDNLNGAVSAAAVTLNGLNTFTANGEDGLDILSQGNITISNISAYYNAGDGANLQNDFVTYQSKVSIIGYGIFNWNGASGSGDGLSISSHGTITAKNLTASLNHDNGADIWTMGLAGKGPQSVTLSGVNTFNNNGTAGIGSGLIVNADGNITVSNLTASINQGTGAYLDNYSNWNSGSFSTFGSVTLTGFGNFTGNVTGNGLYVSTHGKATLAHVVADVNGNSLADNGIRIAADGTVTLMCSSAANNSGDGLWVHNTSGSGNPVPQLILKGFYAYGNSFLDEETYYLTLTRTNCP
jgi:hypothetical protein